MHMRQVPTDFWWGNQRERNHLKYPGVDGRIILRWISRKWEGGLDRWRAVVNAVIKLRFQ